MEKTFFIIFLFLNFLAFSHAESIFLDECENTTNATEVDNCLDIVDEGKKYPDYCCHYSGSTKFCKTVPYSSYRGENTKDYIAGEFYTVTCPKGHKTYALEQCGNAFEEAKSLSDCKKYSTFVDSCCYYKTPENGKNNNFKENSCYWLGSKYEGTINWAGIELECYQKYLNSSLFLIIFIILVLF